MDKLVKVSADKTTIADKVVYADTSQLRKKGVLGRSSLAPNEGVLLAMPPRPGLSMMYSIHMFGVPFEMAIIWLDQDGNILDEKLAKPGKIYFPKGFFSDTRFILEVHPDHYPLIARSQAIQWEDVSG